MHILQNNALRAGTYPLTGFFVWKYWILAAAPKKVTSYRYHKTNCVIYSIFICGVHAAEFENNKKTGINL